MIIKTTADRIAAGDLAAAYDGAMQAIVAGSEAPRLRYLAVLALARMGASTQARAAYDELGVSDIGDVDARALDARLIKDAAFAAPPGESRNALLQAARAYHAIWEITGDPFPGFNAATLFALAGDKAPARNLAQDLLTLPAIDTPANYYDAATRAELLLVLGDTDGARASLVLAQSHAAGDHGARATTRNQLARLTRAIGLDEEARTSLLEPLDAGSVIHYCGRMFMSDPVVESDLRARIDTVLDDTATIAGFGALACGADILVAEALLDHGADLHVVLASSPDMFARTSVITGGEGWDARYRACLKAASSLRVVGEDSYAADPSSFAFSTEVAMGLAITRAAHLSARVCQIAIDDRLGKRKAGRAGTASDVAHWREAGHETIVIAPMPVTPPARADAATMRMHGPERRALSLLFADFKGFTGLAENELPDFWEKVLGTAAGILRKAGDRVLYRNTWGDACFAVFDEPGAAADAALSLQEWISQGWDIPDGGGMRISLHHGLAFIGDDPVLNRQTVYGHEVSRAARIEPITPPGAVYASETFAAAAASSTSMDFHFGYLGRLALPKGFGEERLYRVTRT